MNSVTVIVPVYYGEPYIKSIIKQIELAGRLMNTEDTLELIFVNDAPDAPLKENEYHSDFMRIVVLNTEINRGIHGARVHGLSHAKGEFVIFLDQDDFISENYLYDQLNTIGNADAVVCRLISGKKLQYTTFHKFEDVVTKEYMLNCWNSIESPGQVLIRKDSIPDLWKQNIMKCNGADDYFLWLCMFAEHKIFALNQNVLFEHIVTEWNTSSNTNLMMDSELEMIQILLENHVFSGKDKECLQKLPGVLRKNHVSELEICRNAYSVYDSWLSQTLHGHNPADIFKKADIKTIAIYGAGYIGKSIYKLMKDTDTQIAFYLDRNADYINLEIPAYTIEDSPKNVGGIIISLFKGAENIKADLKKKFSCPIYTIREFLHL